MQVEQTFETSQTSQFKEVEHAIQIELRVLQENPKGQHPEAFEGEKTLFIAQTAHLLDTSHLIQFRVEGHEKHDEVN